MIPLAGGGFSQSGSADSPFSGSVGGSQFGGITTGGGLDWKMMAVIGAVAAVILVALRKR